MSYHNLTHADEVFVGKGYHPLFYNYWNRKGVPVSMPVYKASLGTPAVADADFVIKAATSTELPDTETVTYTPATDGTSPLDGAVDTTTIYPDGSTAVTAWDVTDGATYGRNLVSVTTHSSSVVAMTILISGYDYTLQPMSELHTVTATGTSKTVTGTKAFAYVTSIAITAAADAEANTLNLGTGSVLGLPFALQDIGDIISASIGGVQELVGVASNLTAVAAVATTATTATGDVRGTVTFNGTLDGSAECIVWMHVAEPNTAAGLAGVAQA